MCNKVNGLNDPRRNVCDNRDDRASASRWTRRRSRTGTGTAVSALGAADHVHQLADLATLLGLVAGTDGVFDAVGDVVTQHLLLNPAQRRSGCRDLGHDVDAIAIFLDHHGETANLPLDTFEAFQTG